jgi:hypothetical protein
MADDQSDRGLYEPPAVTTIGTIADTAGEQDDPIPKGSPVKP